MDCDRLSIDQRVAIGWWGMEERKDSMFVTFQHFGVIIGRK